MATVLIVEDEPDMRMLIRASIEASVDTLTIIGEATGGVAGLGMWRGLGGPPVPDIVVLDNRMPGMTGLEVAAEMLRERPAQIIVLYSSYLDQDTRTQAAEIGVAHCIPKDNIGLLTSLLGALGEDLRAANAPRR